MREDAKSWFEQAKRDLLHAEHSIRSEHYEWACFAAHQAAEKALKSALIEHGKPELGHSVRRLIEILHEVIGLNVAQYMDAARELDRHYIPPRYPNAHPFGAPFTHYDKKTAVSALKCAKVFLKLVVRVVRNEFKRRAAAKMQ